MPDLSILLVEDNPGDAVLLREALAADLSVRVTVAPTLGEALAALAERSFGAVLLDLDLPDSSGAGTISRTSDACPEVPIIVMTGGADDDAASQAIGRGAQDYLPKGSADGAMILRAVRYAIERKQAETAIKQAHDELDRKVRERTEELRLAMEDLRQEVRQRLAAENDRREAETAVLETAEREQRRIGRDLHDSIQGSLAGIGMMLHVLACNIRRQQRPAEELAATAEDIGKTVQETLEQTRSLARGLCPVDLGGEGLVGALARLAETTASLFGVPCEFTCDRAVPLWGEAAAAHLYFITREAVSNAVKHSRAKRIDVRLQVRQGRVALSVTDDGRGLPEGWRAGAGMGMKTMLYRASMVGGQLSVGAAAGGGTVVECTLPAPCAGEAEERRSCSLEP